jgi:hypothetical protein
MIASDDPAPLPPASLLKAARRMLRPLVRLMMRNGVTFPVLADVLRALFVEVASQDMLADPKTRTDSRVSLLTGVHRKEIKRLRELGPTDEAEPAVVTTSTQIIARWLGHAAYTDADGRPRPLPRLAQAGGAASFEDLVAGVTTDIRPRAVLDDWISQGLCSLGAEDLVHLNVAAFIPAPGGEEQLFYFARNLHDHVAAAAANVTAKAPPFMDRSLHYDRLTPAAAAQLEAFAREAGMRVLVEANRLAQTLGPSTADEPANKRVNFGVYVYTDHDPLPRTEPE